MDKVNLAAALASFDEAFQPRIVGAIDDYKLMVARRPRRRVERRRSVRRPPRCRALPARRRGGAHPPDRKARNR